MSYVFLNIKFLRVGKLLLNDSCFALNFNFEDIFVWISIICKNSNTCTGAIKKSFY
jgi:hypothetical protein